MAGDGDLRFPVWIDRSGLKEQLAEDAKSPLAWYLFRAIVELDMERHRAPGVVEISVEDLAARTLIEAKKVRTLMKKLRKAGVVRVFLPDNDEEEALLQVTAPLPTPRSWEEVREEDSRLAGLPDGAFRYAHANEDVPIVDDPDKADPKLRAVIDLYFDNVSMKMNSFILDELRLIASRFELPMIRKVFGKARVKEVQTLGWILTDIRREQDIAKGAKQRREKHPERR